MQRKRAAKLELKGNYDPMRKPQQTLLNGLQMLGISEFHGRPGIEDEVPPRIDALPEFFRAFYGRIR